MPKEAIFYEYPLSHHRQNTSPQCVQLYLVPKFQKTMSPQENDRELPQGRQRRRLRKRHKTMRLMNKNKSSARPARAFCILVHFFAVLVLKTTWIDQSWGYVEDVRTWRNILIFFPKQLRRSCQFYSCNVDTHFPFRTTWGYNEINTITGNNIFRVPYVLLGDDVVLA